MPTALLVVGSLLGGAVTYRWQAQRSREAHLPAVVLLAAPVAGRLDDTTTAIMPWDQSTLVEASLTKVALRVDCDAGYPVGTLRAALSVETDAGARRTRALSVTFDGSSWNQRVDAACGPNG